MAVRRIAIVLALAAGRGVSLLDWPIAGVTVSPEGFRVALTSADRARCAPLVVSPRDTDSVASPEVLTLMQLMAGIDCATTVVDKVNAQLGLPVAAEGTERLQEAEKAMRLSAAALIGGTLHHISVSPDEKALNAKIWTAVMAAIQTAGD